MYILCFRLITEKLKRVWKYSHAQFVECPLNMWNDELSTSNTTVRYSSALNVVSVSNQSKLSCPSKRSLSAKLNVNMEKFNCQRCSKCFQNIYKLARDDASHGLIKLECNKCEKISSRKDNMMIHQRKKHM